MRTTHVVGVACALLGVAAGCGSSDSPDAATAGSSASGQGGAGASATAGNAGSSGSGGHSTGTAGSSTAGSMAASAGNSAAGSAAAMAGSSAAGSMAAMDGGAGGGAGRGGMGGTSAAGSGGGPTALPSFDEATGLVDDYGAAHPGQAGDINGKTPAELAADPDAQELLALCGDDQRPVIPALSWEYGGGSHAWINPEMSALVYCVYIPVSPDSDHWHYDAGADHVSADVYLPYPEDNPCEAESGAAQVSECIGDPSNFEILVDTASLNDGHDAGLELSEATSELELILPDHSKVHLFDGL